jgi:uncharacterized glyoxalase superfamily protein PhnB
MATAMPSQSSYSAIIPGMRYRNAAAAIEWLCNAFGFARHLVVPGENNTIAHAQLTFSGGMVMLGSVRDTEFNKNMKQPDEVGGAETQSCYVVVQDPDAHYFRAKAAGAEILVEIHDEDYGGRGYACRDPEGHIWYFGSYNPWNV